MGHRRRGRRRPLGITLGPDDNLWFTTGSGNRIARARLDPAVTTGASALTATGATLAGSVDPFASSTSYTFEYGRTTAYGSATASRVVPPGEAAVPVSAGVGGLASGTLYHYRIVASSAAGTSRGADRTLTTAGAPGGAAGPPGSRDLTGPRVRVVSGSLVMARNGGVAIALRCPLAETLGCRGVVRIETAGRIASGTGTAARRRVLRMGVARFRIGGGQTRAVTIVVSRRGRALVRRLDRVRVRAVVTASDASGNRGITRARLRLGVGSGRS